MSEDIDRTNFLDLKSCDPEEVVSRTGCRFDKTGEQYFVNIWGHKYCVDLNKYEVRPEGPGLKTHHNCLYLFILYYLMKSKNIPPSGVWVSEKDIPGGAAFFRGPHTIPADLITGRFGDNIDLFKKESEKSGGIPIELADASFLFQITPTIPVAVLYWQGDEDFPSEARLLFDRTIEQHLPLDIIYALAVEICHTLGK
ncbi:DUF3786 domain-containing protein [Desulfobacula sp.]|uniref:DUF3786 domain-containing protein n=1 Tax=Desulfobacula sp. TaxID=2593537 RepID=UPI002626A4EE|nr:DUF3786 domain-containing protein [Desulfobacula sp.]